MKKAVVCVCLALSFGVVANEKTDLEKAQERYKQVRAGFYETRTPDKYCKEAVDRQDRYGGEYMFKKREVYLCPKKED